MNVGKHAILVNFVPKCIKQECNVVGTNVTTFEWTLTIIQSKCS